MNTQEASSADTTPVVIEQPPLAVDTQPATLQAQDFAPEPQPADDINPDILPPAEPAESRADALARLVNSNLQSNPPLVDYLTADQLREVFLPIIDFMRAFENASHVPVVYAQAGAPGSAQGLDGDLWVNEDTGDLYAKQQGSWRASTRLRGLDGVTPVKGVNYTDGYTPIRGVDYVDLDSLGAYAQELKDSAVHEATAQVTQAVQAVLANVKTTDGKGLVYTDPSQPQTPPLTPAPGPQEIPFYAVQQATSRWSLPGSDPLTLSYADNLIITKLTSFTPDMTMRCEIHSGNTFLANYLVTFIEQVAQVNIAVPGGGSSYVLLYVSSASGAPCSFWVDSYTTPMEMVMNPPSEVVYL
jgi:hypothetical protein